MSKGRVGANRELGYEWATDVAPLAKPTRSNHLPERRVLAAKHKKPKKEVSDAEA